MKRIISFALALVMLCGMGLLCKGEAGAANSENLCPVFFDQLSVYCSVFGRRSLDTLDAYMISERARWILFEERGIPYL